MKLPSKAIRPMLLPYLMVFAFAAPGCSSGGGGGGSGTATPTYTYIYATNPPDIEANVEGEAWSGELNYSSAPAVGVPVDGDFRISADVEVNIYKYYRGLFCGYGKRTVTQVERWECNAFLVCQWEDRTNMLPGALVTVEGRIYGTIKVSGSNYQMCGFGDVGTPGDPDVPPDRSEIGCDDGPLVTGHLNSNLGDPSSEIFDFDVDEASVTINSNVYTFDFPPVDLPSDSLSGTESTWCGSWLPD